MTDPQPETKAEEGNKPSAGDKRRLQDVHERAMRRFDTVAPAQAEMRRQSLLARLFVTVPGAMWSDGWTADWPEDAPRPEVDKISPNLERIETDYRENRLIVDFLPGEDRQKDTAETLDGIYLADNAHFKAQQARDNAFQEGIRGGFGAWRMTTDYADPYDPDDDAQRINPGLAIVDADQRVYFGPHDLYDASDAKWAFELDADDREEAERLWGAENISAWPLVGWDYQWDWYTEDLVYRANYFEIEETDDDLLIFTQDQSGEEQRYFKSEIEEDAQKDLRAQGWKVRTRTVKRKRVHKYIVNGTCVLKDCGLIAGSNIPIVPFYYRRQFVNGVPWWQGYVQKRMDPARIYNVSVGKVVETQSLAPFPVPIVYVEELDGPLMEEWAEGNIKRYPFRRKHLIRDAQGNPVPGNAGQIEPTQLQPATAALLQMAGADLTDDRDPTDEAPSNTSAEAIELAQNRVDAKSGIALDNMRQSIQREGEIYLGMAPEIYYEPGRKVDTLTIDDQQGQAELSEPTLTDGIYGIRNDLTRGKFKVVASVQESTATKRQKAMRQGLELSQVFMQAQSPPDALAAAYTAAENMDGEGSGDLIAFYRQRSIAIGATKPTPEEQRQIDAAEQQKQGQQDPQQMALVAAVRQAMAEADEASATALEKKASAMLKIAQAHAVGGPEQAPDVPSGLQPANDSAEVVSKLANADLATARAEHLRHDIGTKRIRTGREIIESDRAHELAERQQDHSERQPTAAAG